MILVSIYDAKSGNYGPIKATTNPATAIREFGALCNDPNGTIVSLNPSDFDLYQVGSHVDPFDGKIVALESPLHLANGKDVKNGN